MIYVRLNGGLGNQMFQYAAGRRLALNLKTDLRLDASIFEVHDLRSYALQPFPIVAALADPSEIAALLNPGFAKRLLRRTGLARQLYVREVGLSFDPAILDLADGCYLDGYWQSEKYFKDAEQQIRADFQIQQDLPRAARELAREIIQANSISIHIRRGDYVSDPHTNQVHGTMDASYYARAVSKVKERTESPSFFVFSDDPEWVRSSFQPGVPYRLVTSDWQPFVDMHLMSLCKHNIIANSSFSWWAAWLNSNVDKVVIAPAKWFRDASLDDSSIVPESWIRL
ncbi:MAG: alpha-1,2-fucosyltransferase [Leptospirales bacterium]|nr:alpha-1,2-fucosyltransferase [Leptospirales bacterium]